MFVGHGYISDVVIDYSFGDSLGPLAYRQRSALPANGRASGFDEFGFIFAAFAPKTEL